MELLGLKVFILIILQVRQAQLRAWVRTECLVPVGGNGVFLEQVSEPLDLPADLVTMQEPMAMAVQNGDAAFHPVVTSEDENDKPELPMANENAKPEPSEVDDVDDKGPEELHVHETENVKPEEDLPVQDEKPVTNEIVKPEESPMDENTKPEDPNPIMAENIKPEELPNNENTKPEEPSIVENTKPQEAAVEENMKPEKPSLVENTNPEEQLMVQNTNPEKPAVVEDVKPEVSLIDEDVKPAVPAIDEDMRPEEPLIGENIKPEDVKPAVPAIDEDMRPEEPLIGENIKPDDVGTPELEGSMIAPENKPDEPEPELLCQETSKIDFEPGKTYRIESAKDKLVIDLKESVLMQRNAVIAFKRHKGKNQLWVARHSQAGLAFNLLTAVKINDTMKEAMTYDPYKNLTLLRHMTDGPSQRWYIGQQCGTYVQICSDASHSNAKCLSQSGSGTPLTLTHCDIKDKTQLWRLEVVDA